MIWILSLVLLVALAPTAAAVEQEHTVYLHEYSGGLHIVPEQINARVGDVLKMTVRNEGTTVHNFMVCGDGESPLERCDDRWGFTGMIQPNQTAPLTATVQKAGVFDYFCYIPGHKGGGMAGKLYVSGDEGSKGIPAGGLLGAGLAALVAAAVLGRRAR